MKTFLTRAGFLALVALACVDPPGAIGQEKTATVKSSGERTLTLPEKSFVYADVDLPAHFKTPAATRAFIVPAAALIFRREGLRIGLVVNGGVAHLVPIVIGEDDGANVQVVSGLSSGDQVIQDPPDSLIEGEKVRVESSGSHADAGGK